MCAGRIDRPQAPAPRRTGLILPVVLLVIALLTLLGSSFSWLAQADFTASEAGAHRVTARLAAESGLQRVLVLLRTRDEDEEEMLRWWDNPDELAEQLIWIPGREDEGITDENRTVEDLEEDEPAWLYSIVADDPDSDEPLSMRFGLTDEASKLHLNVISGQMMGELIRQTVPDADELDIEALVDAFLDWRDEDIEIRPNGAEKSYYESLRPPYEPRNGRFRTVEELLMVRGFTSRVLYGEDQNRNGILDPNEDDGETTFPEDDADGQLSRGIYPYLTVYSREMDVSESGQTKPDVNSANEAALATVTSREIASYIVAARKSGIRFGSFEDLVDSPAVPSPDGKDTIPNPITLDDLPSLQDALTLTPAEDLGAAAQGTGPAGQSDEDPSEDLGLPQPSPDAPPGVPMVEGRININTAPAPVLMSLGVFSEEEVTNIISVRRDLDDEQRTSLSWLTASGAVSGEAFAQAVPYLTTRAEQYTIESVGYAHHLGVLCRLQAVVEMRWKAVPYFLYYRDVSALGPGYPVQQLLTERGEGERTFARTRPHS